MLVLSRKAGESVYISDAIKVTVLDIGATQVKISFECPPHITILREEILKQVADSNIMAQKMNKNDYEGVKALWNKTQKQ